MVKNFLKKENSLSDPDLDVDVGSRFGFRIYFQIQIRNSFSDPDLKFVARSRFGK